MSTLKVYYGTSRINLLGTSLERQIKTSPGRHFRRSPGQSNRIFRGRPGDVGGDTNTFFNVNFFKVTARKWFHCFHIKGKVCKAFEAYMKNNFINFSNFFLFSLVCLIAILKTTTERYKQLCNKLFLWLLVKSSVTFINLSSYLQKSELWQISKTCEEQEVTLSII